MTQDELMRIHLSAPARWDMDTPDVDQALTEAGLNPADPSSYTQEQALAAYREYKSKIGSVPFSLYTVTCRPTIGIIKVKR